MKKLYESMLIIMLLSIIVSAQNTNSSSSAKPANSSTNTNQSTTDTKRSPVFRANKDQITQAQTMLKQKGLYAGEATGKLDDDTRSALKKFQENEKIRSTGTLNRITLERLGIKLTDKQLLIPVSENSLKPDTSNGEKATRAAVFRATKDQIMQAQKMLKDKNLYTGEQTGKMEDDFRTAIKKFQDSAKIKVTGTLNRETLEKMGIALTDNQKSMAANEH